MAAKQDQAGALAARLLQTLEGSRFDPAAPPLTLRRLGELTDPQTPPKLLLKAAGKKPFIERALVARKKDPAAPVTLRSDLEQLAASPALLEYALELACTPQKPAQPLGTVGGKLDAELRAPFLEAVNRRLADNTLPATVGAVTLRGKPALFLRRMPPPPPPRKPEEALAEKLLRVLEAQRRLGASAYPLPLQRLAELTDPQVPAKVLNKAAGSPAFLGQALVARKKDPAAPVALRSDLEQLAASPLLLEYALGRLCTPRKPTQPLGSLVRTLEEELRPPFQEAVNRRVAEYNLPETVGSRTVNGIVYLFLQRLPPLRYPEEVLAEKLLATLEAHRDLGGGAYPMPLQQLLALADAEARPRLVKAVLATQTAQNRIVLATKPSPDTLATLGADRDQLATSPLLLEFLLRTARTADSNAQPLPDLTRKLTPVLRKPFADHLGRQIKTATLPPTVGCVLHKKKPLLFLLEDLQREPHPEPEKSVPKAPAAEATPAAAPSAPDFEEAFTEAFERLQQQPGADNYVSLVDLRQTLPTFDRAAFDAGLERLRGSGRYALRLADGRFGISAAEQEAGIPTAGGALWLFVSRNAP